MTEHDQRDPLEELAEAFAEACRKGEVPSIDELARQHPSLAEEIRELFPTIASIESNKDQSDRFSDNQLQARAGQPERIGDFRILREIGRGGMGVVYEAEQESLGRHVAIKVLPTQYAEDTTRRLRFEREAQTAAKLHHTNIVPIFGVGVSDGYQYIVLQYIPGVGLDAVIAELRHVVTTGDVPRAWHAEASTSTDASTHGLLSVVHALHGSRTSGSDATRTDATIRRESGADSELRTTSASTGTLTAVDLRDHSVHEASDGKDADPAQGHDEVIVGSGVSTPIPSRGARDWRGVARIFVRAADALSYAHRQGVLHRDIKPANLLLDLDGTLWIADFGLARTREQEDLTKAGDVVGTLRYMAPEQLEGGMDERSDIYSLGVSLYELASLHPATGDEQINIRKRLDQPIRSPRAYCPDMPRDLETIIMKACARDPGDRYASATNFRDDLVCFIEDRPISARRPALWERAWRWSRRRPALAATTAVTLLLMIAIPIITSVAYFEVVRANEMETAQRMRAEATTRVAIDAIDLIFDEFAPDSTIAVRELSSSDDDSYGLSISDPLVLSPEIVKLLKHMLQFYSQLATETRDTDAWQVRLANAKRRIGEIHHQLGEMEEAEKALADALTTLEREKRPGDAERAYAYERAMIHNHRGLVYVHKDEMPKAREDFEAALKLFERAQSEADADQRDAIAFQIARTCFHLALRPESALSGNGPRGPRGPHPGQQGGPRRPGPRRGRPGDADRLERERPPYGARPGGPGLRPPPGPGGFRPGGPGPRPDREFRPVERNKWIERCESVLRELLERTPDNPEYRFLLALTLREKEQGVLARWLKPGTNQVNAVSMLRALVDDYPDVIRYQMELAESQARAARGRNETEDLEVAIKTMNDVVAQAPNATQPRFALAHLYHQLSRAWFRQHNTLAAREAIEQAVRIQAKLSDEFPDVKSYRVAAALYESLYAKELEHMGDEDESSRQLERAIARLDSLMEADEPRPGIRHLIAVCFEQRGEKLRNQGRDELADEAFDISRRFRLPPHNHPLRR
ncbi:MAG: protein kinase domain-containing protein [Phycisphaerae bacterium]